jgi:hypothetical protein
MEIKYDGRNERVRQRIQRNENKCKTWLRNEIGRGNFFLKLNSFHVAESSGLRSIRTVATVVCVQRTNLLVLLSPCVPSCLPPHTNSYFCACLFIPVSKDKLLQIAPALTWLCDLEDWDLIRDRHSTKPILTSWHLSPGLKQTEHEASLFRLAPR